tara:strand:+ start:1586 stop:1954 length:369 start_codon:yes stop_codon:yes gene_type:complete
MIHTAILFTKLDNRRPVKSMSGLERKLGPGYQQIVIGMLIFATGALWGVMLASGDEINLKDLFISAVVMLSGAMITMLGISFGTDYEDDRTNDLQDAIAEMTSMLNALQAKISGSEKASEEE